MRKGGEKARRWDAARREACGGGSGPVAAVARDRISALAGNRQPQGSTALARVVQIMSDARGGSLGRHGGCIVRAGALDRSTARTKS